MNLITTNTRLKNIVLKYLKIKLSCYFQLANILKINIISCYVKVKLDSTIIRPMSFQHLFSILYVFMAILTFNAIILCLSQLVQIMWSWTLADCDWFGEEVYDFCGSWIGHPIAPTYLAEYCAKHNAPVLAVTDCCVI